MSKTEIIAALLALPRKDLEEIEQMLKARLHDEDLSEAEWNESWGKEAERRLAEIREGTVKTISMGDVFAEARARRG